MATVGVQTCAPSIVLGYKPYSDLESGSASVFKQNGDWDLLFLTGPQEEMLSLPSPTLRRRQFKLLKCCGIFQPQVMDMSKISVTTLQNDVLYCNGMQDGKSSIQQQEDSFHQQIGLKIKKETSKVLQLEHGCVWCWKPNTSKNTSEIPRKFWNVVLEKDGRYHLEPTYEKWRSITKRQVGK